MTSTTPLYSVVVPVYCSEQTLEPLCARILDVFDKHLAQTVEIILVDDASSDGSWDRMQNLHKNDGRIRIIQLAGNFGQHNALMCGFAHARGEYVVTLDDDLQHPPEEISKMIVALQDHPNTDVIIGAYESKQHSWVRNAGTRAMNMFSSLVLGKDPKLQMTSFRLIRRYIVEAIIKLEMENPRVGRLILETTNRIVNTPVRHDPRKYGKSGYSFRRLVKDFVGNILNNSAVPLEMISYLGFVSASVSFLLAIYYLYRYFFVGISIAGWTTLVLLNLFYFGTLLFSVGIIGEYLIRILRETKRMPQYVIREKQL